MKKNKRTPTIRRDRISDDSYGRAVKSPGPRKESGQERRKKDSDRHYDFTSDHDIIPPREERKRK